MAYDYRYHNLKKEPNDLPDNGDRVLFYVDTTKTLFGNFEYNCYTGTYFSWCDTYYFENDDTQQFQSDKTYDKGTVKGWRYIPPAEEE